MFSFLWGKKRDNFLPDLFQFGVGENFGDDPGSVDGRVGVEGTDEDLDLGHHAVGLLLVLDETT